MYTTVLFTSRCVGFEYLAQPVTVTSSPSNSDHFEVEVGRQMGATTLENVTRSARMKIHNPYPSFPIDNVWAYLLVWETA